MPGTAEGPGRLREQRGWYVYDWASSAFSTTVATVFLGPYLTDVTKRAADVRHYVHPFGIPVRDGSFFAYTVSLSVLLTVFLLPLVGAIADRTRRKTLLLGLFAYAGAVATMALYLVRDRAYLLGGALFLLANVAFGASIVVYNSFLPEIAAADERDSVSARGWALGYLGGGLLLAANLVLFSAHGALGVSKADAVRISMFSAGAWWALWTLVPLRRLGRHRPPARSDRGSAALADTFRQLGRAISSARGYPLTLAFLLAYLIYNDGIQTVIALASVFGADELHLTQNTLIITILIVQFVAFGGALIFGILARIYGAKRTVLGSLIVWALAVGLSFVLPARRPLLFFGLGVVIGLVLGGSQALTRSMFSQLIPAGLEAEYFGLYEIADRGTSWLGPLVFGLTFQLTGSYRYAILSLVAFFVLGGAILARIDMPRAVAAAGNPVPHRT